MADCAAYRKAFNRLINLLIRRRRLASLCIHQCGDRKLLRLRHLRGIKTKLLGVHLADQVRVPKEPLQRHLRTGPPLLRSTDQSLAVRDLLGRVICRDGYSR